MISLASFSPQKRVSFESFKLLNFKLKISQQYRRPKDGALCCGAKRPIIELAVRGGFVNKKSNNGVIGLALIGVGAAIVAAGFTLVTPVCFSWSRNRLQDAYQKGKKGVISGFESAAETLGDVASKAQTPLGEAAKAARHTTAIAAGAVESAAHYVREHVS
jgi:hypothetical protein